MKLLVLPAGSRQGGQVCLRGKDHHYLVHVRRIAVGDSLNALDGDQRLSLTVVRIDETTLTLTVASREAAKSRGVSLALFPFLLKGRKLDDVIRQACEAGVDDIYPVEGEHCVARQSDSEHKTLRWNQIVREAAQQSGQPRVPLVHDTIKSSEIPLVWANQGLLLFFHQVPLDTGTLHRYLFSRPSRIGLVIGPEGGLSKSEVTRFRTQGAVPVWLGPFVLRAETASLYAVAAVNSILQETPEWTIR